jgi:hypothetical protein
MRPILRLAENVGRDLRVRVSADRDRSDRTIMITGIGDVIT